MLASKILRNSRALLCRNVLEAKNSGEPLRRCHVAAVPPRIKISTGEKVAYAVVLSVSMCFIPFWILYHVPDYQNEKRDEYTGK